MNATKLRIKICGITHEEHLHAAAEAGADLVGLVLWPGSARALSRERAESLAALARTLRLESVALVVDAPEAELRGLDTFDRVQCHGAEPCAALASIAKPTIRGFPFTPEALRTWDDCRHVTWLLVDSARGGSGASFDHAAVAPHVAALRKPLLLAGGLTPDNVAGAIERVRPFGVDVSSGVERRRGAKDPELIRAFCAAARGASAS